MRSISLREANRFFRRNCSCIPFFPRAPKAHSDHASRIRKDDVAVKGTERTPLLPVSSDAEMSRELAAAVVEYPDLPDRLKVHKENAYWHFLSLEFNQAAIVVRFAKLLGFQA